MSTTLAIAAVTATLKFLLQSSLTAYKINASVGNDLRISVLPPDKVPTDAPRLNLFFYRAAPNLGWLPQGQPSRNQRGDRVTNPYLALDLHYLITAHGTKEYHGEILLGYALQLLHEQPVLPRSLIRDALSSPTLHTTDTPAALLALIAAAELADQVEQIKFTPQPLDLEELSHLWSTLQTGYRPTALYTATVVLIESKRPAQPALPVRGYNVYVEPFRQPRILEVSAEDGPGAPILASKKLVLKGQSLRGGDTRVLVGGVEISGGALAISNEQITVTLPGTVRAGVQAVQVKQYLEMGTPPAAHRGYESNVVAIVLQPEITKTGANYNITIVPPAGDQPRKLRIGVNPVVEPTQRAELLLNELNAPATRPPFAFALPAELRAPGSAPVAELTFPIGTVPAGDYLVRLRIDGADSPLDLDPVQGYTGPVQTL